MGYATWRTWIKTQLDTIAGLNSYGYPTDKYNYPAALVKIGQSVPDIDQETNRSVLRRYEIEIQLIVGAHENLQDEDDVERIFAEKLDAIIEKFDSVENRGAGGTGAWRQRVVRVNVRDIVSPDPKRIADVTLEFIKRND